MKTTYEKTAELLKSGNKKEIYDTLYFASKMSRIDAMAGVAGTIAEFLAACSTTFVQDIARKYGEYRMSEKQLWCMTYDAIKITHMIDAWIENELSK